MHNNVRIHVKSVENETIMVQIDVIEIKKNYIKTVKDDDQSDNQNVIIHRL